MTTDKPALSTRFNQFWARMLAPINAYLGTALIALALIPNPSDPPILISILTPVKKAGPKPCFISLPRW